MSDKIGILVLADDETHGDMGRITNALEVAKEFSEGGDEVKIVFDGAATKWIGQLADSGSQLNPLYQAVEKHIEGACKFCAGAFGVTNQVKKAGVTLLDDYDDHPSVRNLVKAGYQVMTF